MLELKRGRENLYNNITYKKIKKKTKNDATKKKGDRTQRLG